MEGAECSGVGAESTGAPGRGAAVLRRSLASGTTTPTARAISCAKPRLRGEAVGAELHHQDALAGGCRVGCRAGCRVWGEDAEEDGAAAVDVDDGDASVVGVDVGRRLGRDDRAEGGPVDVVHGGGDARAETRAETTGARSRCGRTRRGIPRGDLGRAGRGAGRGRPRVGRRARRGIAAPPPGTSSPSRPRSSGPSIGRSRGSRGPRRGWSSNRRTRTGGGAGGRLVGIAGR